MIQEISKSRKLKKITMAASVAAMGIGLVTSLSSFEGSGGDQGQKEETFYSGFSMASVWKASSTTLNAQVGASTTGISAKAGSTITYTPVACCIATNAGSACDFSRENGSCATSVVRPAHTNQVYP